MAEKLDNFNKILLATGTINYMASTLEGVRIDYIHLIAIQEKNGVNVDLHKRSLEEKEEMLSETVLKLNAILEDLGNFLDGQDIVCAIDQRVYDAPLHILLHGQDEVDVHYDDLDEDAK